MLQREINLYRKFVGLCQLSTVRPLMLTPTGDNIILKNGDNKTLLVLPKDVFDDMSVYDILTAAGITPNDNI